MMLFHIRSKCRYCAILVVTLLACPVAIAAGFDDNYKVRVGDFDSDGFVDDLFVQAVPEVVILHGEVITPIVIGPDIPSFVLRGEIDNTFTIVSTLTPGQLQTMSQWPVSSVELTANDFNYDGYVDLGIANVASAISTAADQIVFVDATTGTAPAVVLNADSAFGTFIDDVFQWYLDHEYYDVEILVDVATYSYFGIALNDLGLANLFFNCELLHGDCVYILADLNLVFADAGRNCVQEFIAAGENPNTFCRVGFHVFIESTTQQTAIVQDLSNIHPSAANVIQKSNEYEEGNATIEDVADIFEIEVGVVIGGEDVPVDDENLDSPEEQRGFDIHVVLADIWGWIFGESRSATRAPENVYVTGRRVAWVGPFHTALEYSSPAPFLGPPTQYLSAGPENGFLRSKKDNQSEARNVTLGRVVPINLIPDSLWLEMRFADDDYPDDCLDYDLFPGIQDGYNSNSWVHGLILATDGIVDIDMTKFVGGGKPVPATFFSLGATCPN